MLKTVFRIGITLNLIYLIAETFFGFCLHSMGLLADAVQNLCDVAGMILILSAYKLSDPEGTNRFNFGFKRGAMLLAMGVSLLTGILITFMVWGSVRQIHFPRYLDGKLVSIIAAIGVVVNGLTAVFFWMIYSKRLHMRGAYRHMLADTIVSLVVMVAGIVILFTRWYILDALVALAVLVIIAFALWELWHGSIRLVLDGVPSCVDYEQLVKCFYDLDEVADVHHLHVWAVSPGANALTANVRLHDASSADKVGNLLRERIQQQGVQFVTLEFEAE